ncbi:magnesium transporter CorA family protein [Actinomyces trachealis]|uniref:magnesium transporter CorA family protein n=1 Tax=Actinomyces trachealis TaxID=2763540 RepID=UPI001892CCEF|nr:magnesium transporter CorA family protein [Actinomyces trachealis]
MPAAFRSLTWRQGVPAPEAVPANIYGISEALAEPDLLTWADIVAPEPEDLKIIAAELGLDTNAVEDATAPHERAKAFEHDDYSFFIVYAALPGFASTEDDEEKQLSRVAGFVFPNGLLTVRRSGAIDMEPVVRRWRANRHLLHLGSAALVHGFLDVVVDGYLDTVQELDVAIENLESDLFAPATHSTDFQRSAYDVRTKLVTLRRVVLPMREVISTLWRYRDESQRDLDPYYSDLLDHALRASEWTESLRDMIATVFETHLSLQDQRLNTVMKKLAGWAAVISVPTLVTGWFGTNVPYPGSGEGWGVWVAAAMVVLPAFLLWVFLRKKDWI